MSGAIYNDFSQFTTLRAEATKNPNAALEDVATPSADASAEACIRVVGV